MTPQLHRWTADQLSALGYRSDFRAEPLLVEASNRHFYRIHARGSLPRQKTLVAMSSPPELENNAQFLVLADLFAAHGVGVPDVIAAAIEPGFFLLSDLGQQHFVDVYESAKRESALELAIDTLIRIQAVDDPAVPPYEAQRFRDELGIFRDWFVQGWLGEDLSNLALDDVFELLVANTQQQVQCCVHRDFHCRNLLFRDDSNPRIGVVDFQDALVGPLSYDLASLLRDCYYRFTEPEIDHWRDRYLQQTPFTVDPTRFAAHLDLTAVQRQLKAIGIFARLQLRDGKSTHLQHILPVLSHLADLAERYGQLTPLRSHLSRWRGAAIARLEADQ